MSTRSGRARWAPTPTRPSRPSARSPSTRSTPGRVATASRGAAAHGRVDLVAEAYDATSIPISGPWHDKPLTPALLRSEAPGRRAHGHRLAHRGRLSATYPSNEFVEPDVHELTRQNKEIWDARYGFYLVHGSTPAGSATERYVRAGRGDQHPRQQRTGPFPSRLPTTHESRVTDIGRRSGATARAHRRRGGDPAVHGIAGPGADVHVRRGDSDGRGAGARERRAGHDRAGRTASSFARSRGAAS